MGKGKAHGFCTFFSVSVSNFRFLALFEREFAGNFGVQKSDLRQSGEM